MKNLLTILFITTSILIAQSGSINYEELIKQYPQLKANNSIKNASIKKDPDQPIHFDFTDYTDAELLMLDSLGVLSALLDTIKV
jgi:hypothetical protein